MELLPIKNLILRELKNSRYRYSHFLFLRGEDMSVCSIEESDTWSITLPVGEPLNEIQLTITFAESYLDVLAFPHPIILDREQVFEMERFINLLNGYVKLQNSNGRFYVDEVPLDIAYSARVSYQFLTAFPTESMENGMMGFWDIIADAAIPLYGVAKGEMDTEAACRYMVEIWQQNEDDGEELD